MIVSLAALEKILQSEDIEGLHTLGAPADEYGHEAREIQAALAQLDNEITSDEVSTVVMGVWSRAFGPFSGEDIRRRKLVFREVAHRIVEDGHVRVADEEPETSAGAGNCSFGA